MTHRPRRTIDRSNWLPGDDNDQWALFCSCRISQTEQRLAFNSLVYGSRLALIAFILLYSYFYKQIEGKEGKHLPPVYSSLISPFHGFPLFSRFSFKKWKELSREGRAVQVHKEKTGTATMTSTTDGSRARRKYKKITRSVDQSSTGHRTDSSQRQQLKQKMGCIRIERENVVKKKKQKTAAGPALSFPEVYIKGNEQKS